MLLDTFSEIKKVDFNEAIQKKILEYSFKFEETVFKDSETKVFSYFFMFNIKKIRIFI